MAAEVALGEVVLGALLGFVAAYLLARFQADREDRYRFAMIKQVKYAEFIRLARQHTRVIQLQMDLRVSHPMQKVDDVPTLDSTEPIDLLSAEFAILADTPIWTAARDLYDALVALDAFAWDDSKPPTYLHAVDNVGGYPANLDVFNRAQARFMEAASRDLGTTRRWKLRWRGFGRKG
jgi:hypothetical protein